MCEEYLLLQHMTGQSMHRRKYEEMWLLIDWVYACILHRIISSSIVCKKQHNRNTARLRDTAGQTSRGLYLTYNAVPQYIWGYFSEMCNKSHWIQQRMYRLAVCNRCAFALSRRCRVSRSRPCVCRETVTNMPLWRHISRPFDNEESIAANSNAIPRTMGCITI